MQIVCPHCTTSYAVNAASFGSAGRTVRCARCKETWVAYPEPEPVTYAVDTPVEDDWHTPPQHEEPPPVDVPVVESPPISGDIPDREVDDGATTNDVAWAAMAREDDLDDEPAGPRSLADRLGLTALSLGPLARPGALPFGLPVLCATMGAMVIALVVWRADIVRILPQTATFFKMAGLGVNLRGLAFEDVKVSTEVVDNKPVLVIEGNVVDIAKKPIEIPRLRFLVRDARGTEIYAWNAVLEQPVLQAGERAWFKTRLASPPAEGREVAVRFFNKRDIAAGGI